LFVVSGPSAVGKTSIISELLKMDNSLKRVVTCTTRSAREMEQHGIDYFFMSKEEFRERNGKGEFVEFSEVYGNYYGVMLSTVAEKIHDGESAVLAMNWEGFAKIKGALGKNTYGFFITPPSLNDLETRIRSRGTDSEETIDHRLKMAESDMAHSGIFDFCVENRNILETATTVLKRVNQIRNIS
jgi:guanylate kinase